MTIADVFIKRYPETLVWGQDGWLPAALGGLLRQLAHVVVYDLVPLRRDPEQFCRAIHDQLARELGVITLGRASSYQEVCAKYLGVPYDLWNNDHRSPDYFFKTRVSL